MKKSFIIGCASLLLMGLSSVSLANVKDDDGGVNVVFHNTADDTVVIQSVTVPLGGALEDPDFQPGLTLAANQDSPNYAVDYYMSPATLAVVYSINGVRLNCDLIQLNTPYIGQTYQVNLDGGACSVVPATVPIKK